MLQIEKIKEKREVIEISNSKCKAVPYKSRFLERFQI